LSILKLIVGNNIALKHDIFSNIISYLSQ